MKPSLLFLLCLHIASFSVLSNIASAQLQSYGELANAISRWDVYRNEQQKAVENHHKVEGTVTRADGTLSTKNFQRWLTTSGNLKRYWFQADEKDPVILLENNKYYAAIKKQATDNSTEHYSLETVTLKDGAKTLKDLGPLFAPLGESVVPFRGLEGVACSVHVLAHPSCRITEVKSEPNGDIAISYSKNPQGNQPTKADSSPSVDLERASQMLDLFPQGKYILRPTLNFAIVDFFGENPELGIKTHEVFSDYERIDDAFWYPKVLISTRSGKLNSTYKETLVTATSKPISNNKVFWLSHYGIPEPKGSGGVWPSWVTLAVLTIGAVLIFSGYVLQKKRVEIN